MTSSMCSTLKLMSSSGCCLTVAIGLLFFLLTIKCSSATPLPQMNDSTYNLTKQVYWGMEILTVLERNLDVAIDDIKYLRNDDMGLNLKVLCNMYDLYRDHTFFLSAIQPDDPLHSNYSSTQYVAWKSMQTACRWTIRNNSNLLPDNCTLAGIARTCYTFHFRSLVNLKVQLPVMEPIISSEWITENGLPHCASNVIEDVINESVNGR